MQELPENKELSEREIEVVRLLAAGLSNKEIAGQLFLSVNTVKVHLRNIFAKLDVQSRTEATWVAIQRGWVSVPQVAAPQAEAQAASAALDVPRIVVEPPLPVWRRAVLMATAVVALAGVIVSGVRANPGASAGSDVFSDRPAAVSPAQSAAGDTLWTALAQMPTARTRLAVTAYAGRLVAIGGDTPNGVTAAVEWLDSKTGDWVHGKAKPAAVSNVAAVAIGDSIFVPGGMTAAGVPTTTVEVYQARADEWSQATPLPAPRMAYAATAFDGRVYVIGGWDGSAYAASVFALDPAAGRWEQRTPMPAPRGFAAAVALASAIYVVGGFDGQVESSRCERYLPVEDRWDGCPSMSVGRGGLSVVAIGNNLYAIGGGWSGYLAFNEVWTLGSEAWRAIPTPFIGQWRGLGATAIDAEIFAVGGWNGQYLSVTEKYSPFPFKIFVPAAQDSQAP